VKQQAIVVGVAVVALAVLYAVLRPAGEAAPAVAVASGTAVAPVAVAPALPAVALNVDAPADTQLSARLGEVVLLDVRSAKAGTLQAHGLAEKAFPIAVGTTRITLPAAALGSFALHFHGAQHEHATLATLAVLPR
jgi:hypothetical protein